MLALLLAAAMADDGGLLARAQVQLAAQTRQLANYTCVETIERVARGEPCADCRTEDRVRLEVAVVEGEERLALPGAREFSRTELQKLAPSGLISWGDYAGALRATVLNKRAAVSYAGVEVRERRLARYDYRVAVADMPSTLSSGAASIPTGLAGSFWIDPDSLVLVRLETNLTEIPRHFPIASMTSAIEYQQVQGARGSFLVPARADRKAEDRGRHLTTTHTVFSGCREYLAESKIRFDAPDEAASSTATAAADKLAPIPDGVHISASLDQPLDFKTAAAGDPVSATVSKAVKSGGRVVAPKGALLRGRISLAQVQLGGPETVWALGFRFTELESGGASVPFRGILIEVPNATARTYATIERRPAAHVTNEDGEGVVAYSEGPPRLPKGYPMVWKTEAAAAPSAP